MTIINEVHNSRNRLWNILLWSAQCVLASIYGIAGTLKVSQPISVLTSMGIGYAADYPEMLTRFIGTMELLGSIAIIVPALIRTAPFFTSVAALGFSAIQVLAIALHASRGELAESLPMNAFLLSLSLFVLWGRKRLSPTRRFANGRTSRRNIS